MAWITEDEIVLSNSKSEWDFKIKKEDLKRLIKEKIITLIKFPFKRKKKYVR